jgi:hypothetical protein
VAEESNYHDATTDSLTGDGSAQLYSRYNTWMFLLGFIIVGLIGSMAFLSTTDQASSVSDMTDTDTVTVSKYDIDVKVTDDIYEDLASKDYLPWDTIAAFQRDQRAIVNSSYTTTDGDYFAVDDDHDVVWNIFGETYEGSSALFKVTSKPGVSTCSVTISKDGSQLIYHEFTMAAKYVRREIRSMTDDDRNTFLDALHTMYTVPMAEGKVLYGDKYVDAAYCLKKHLYGAGRTDCDHWHDGAGTAACCMLPALISLSHLSHFPTWWA